MIKNNILKQMALNVTLGIFLIGTNANAFLGVGDEVFDPTSYAALLESIEKYNSMIATMNDTLDTMNRINDLMNTSTNFLNNMQLGIANPLQLADRFQSNLDRIQRTLDRVSNNISKAEWKDSILSNQYATCKTKWQELRAKYPEKYENNTFAMEVEANMAWLDAVNNDGLVEANKNINSFFDDLINNYSITDIESQIADNKDPKTTTVRTCELIDREYLYSARDDCLKDYHKAVADKNLSKAQTAKDCIRDKDKALREKSIKDKNDRITKLDNIVKIRSDEKATLSYNYSSCTLNNEAKWKDTLSVSDTSNVLEKRTISSQDSSGNVTNTQEVCAVTQETINQLFELGRYNDAINLQNQRNMTLALGKDSYALEQAQLETLEMIANLINSLTDSVNALAQINLDELKTEANSENDINDYLKKDQDTLMENWINSINSYEKGWEYDQYGFPVRKYNR